MRRLFLILFIGISIYKADAQTIVQFMQWGDEAFTRQEFMAAGDYYAQVLKKNPGIAEVNFKLAECYRMLRDYRQALPLYKEVFREDEEKFPLSRFWYAELLKGAGDYDKAASAYRAFLRKNRGFTEYQHQLMVAAHEAETCARLAGDAAVAVPSFCAESFQMNGPYNDFSPVYLNDSSLIVSVLLADTLQSNRYRFALLRLDAGATRADTVFQDLHYSYTFTAGRQPQAGTEALQAKPGRQPQAGTEALQAKPVRQPQAGTEALQAKPVRQPQAGTEALQAKPVRQPQEVWYAACPMNAAAGECKLYHGYLGENGIKQAALLPELLNPPGANQRQPMFSSQNGNAWLYFASDKPGGFGGYDLYRSQLVNDSYQTPENLGSAVNSPVDELCPFYYEPEQSLFFSSTWYNSLGGFDIFQSQLSTGGFEAPQNLGRQFNSTQDELYYQLSFFEERGWFTSNRPTGKEEYPACCADIYTFKSVAALPDSILAIRIHRKKEKEINEVRQLVLEIPPFDLYFDNDEPNPQSRDSVTSDDYLSLYQRYINRKEQYRQQFTSAFAGEEVTQAANRIDSFFDVELQQGMIELNPFLEKLSYLLENECAVEIHLESFASPLNKSDYNLLLSKRRIQSLLNYFDTVFNGSLEQAIQEGRLQIYVKALGDSQADATVSADLKDTAHSVYSPEAARERRISIVSVKVNRIFTPAKPLQND